MGNRNGPHRGGVPRVKVALRDALRIYVVQHLQKYPVSWFTAVDLARVIHEQYVMGERQVSWGPCRYGRSNVLLSILRELEDAAEVVSKPAEHRKDCRVWKLAA